MAKMYYNVEEAMAKLGCSEEQFRGLVRTGKLREFRDAGKLNYRVEEVDKLAGLTGDNVLGHDSGELAVEDIAEIALTPVDTDSGILRALSSSGSLPGLSGTDAPIDLGGTDTLSLSSTGTADLKLDTGTGSEINLGTKGGTSELDLSGSKSDTSELNLSGSKSGTSELNLGTKSGSKSGSGSSLEFELEKSKSGTRGGSTAELKLDDTGSGSRPGVDALSLDEVDKDAVQGMKKDDTVITNIGISVFDDDDLEIAADPMAKTLMTGSDEHLGLDGSGGGSGLLDLTRESDDTSLGAELLEGIDMGDTAETMAQSVDPAPRAADSAGEEPLAVVPGLSPAVGVVPVQVVSGYIEPLSPAFTGLLIAATIVLALAGAMNIAVALDAWPGYLQLLADQFWFFLGGTVLLGGLCFLVGWFVGKPSTPRPPKAVKDKPVKEKPVKEKKGKDKGKAAVAAAKG